MLNGDAHLSSRSDGELRIWLLQGYHKLLKWSSTHDA